MAAGFWYTRKDQYQDPRQYSRNIPTQVDRWLMRTTSDIHTLSQKEFVPAALQDSFHMRTAGFPSVRPEKVDCFGYTEKREIGDLVPEQVQARTLRNMPFVEPPFSQRSSVMGLPTRGRRTSSVPDLRLGAT
jgi:hypothetical protein